MPDWNELVREAQEIVEATLQQLPTEIRERAEAMPISLEDRPTEEMEEEGIAPDTLGLFVGESHDAVGEGLAPLPAQILLFLENLWDFAESDWEKYREEVSVTLLHEIGHYLGLDEDDLFDRGLD